MALEPAIAEIAQRHSTAKSAFFIGRTHAVPVALEGAQKLKELSYIHAEAYPSSELKHGPLALLTAETPCIVVLPQSELFDKALSSVEEVRARDAPVIAVTDAPWWRIDKLADAVIRVPPVEPLLQGIVMGVALQLFAYHAALSLGRDIDRPRNLAKSVTGEVDASAVAAVAANEGIIVVESANSVDDTYAALVAAVDAAPPLTVIAEVDHAANAASVGLELRPTRLLVFGNPNNGTPLMQAGQTAGIDLPVKFLVFEAESGQVSIAYNDPAFIASRHGISGQDELVGQIATALNGLATAAAAAPN